MLEYLMMINRSGTGDTAVEADGPTNAQSRAGLGRREEVGYRLGALELAVETLVRLGVENNTFTEEQFFAMARKIDAEDGSIDGQRDLARMTKLCPRCGKPNSGNKAKCMWCEADMADAQQAPGRVTEVSDKTDASEK